MQSQIPSRRNPSNLQHIDSPSRNPINHLNSPSRLFRQVQQSRSESGNENWRNHLREHPPGPRVTESHQPRLEYPPDTFHPTYAQVVEQGPAIFNARMTTNRGTRGFTRPGTAQSGYPAHRDARTSNSSEYTNRETMQSASDVTSYFEDDFCVRYPEQAFRHNSTSSGRSPIPIYLGQGELEVHGELHDDSPWSPENPRRDQGPPMPGMPCVSFDTLQTNGTSNVTSFTGPDPTHLSGGQDFNNDTRRLSQGYPEPRFQDEGGRSVSRPEYSHQQRTPRHSQPRPRASSNVSIQHGHANQAARSFDGRSLPSSSTTSMPPDPLYCPNCDAFFTGRYRKGNLARHRRHNHKPGAQSYICEVEDCGRLYARGDARLKHYRKHHPELDVPEATPRDRGQSNPSASFQVDQHALIGLMSPY